MSQCISRPARAHFLAAASLLTLALAGCNKASDSSNSGGSASDASSAVAENRAAAPGDISVTQAKGLSYSYQYGFRMPADRIAAAQEESASNCEAMGITQCRITGMTYDVGRDHTVNATLALALAPDIARKYGKGAIATTVTHGGMLSSSRIDSENSGAVIADTQANNTANSEEHARIQQQLAQPGLGRAERESLQEQLANLSQSTRENNSTVRSENLKLASTPMQLTYETGDVDQSLSGGPIMGAFKDGWSNIISGVAVIVDAVVTLIPWLLLLVAGIFAWRRLAPRVRKFAGRSRPDDEA